MRWPSTPGASAAEARYRARAVVSAKASAVVGEPNQVSPAPREGVAAEPGNPVEERAPERRATNGTPSCSRRSSAGFLGQKWGTFGVWSQLRMLVRTNRRTPVRLAATARLASLTVSICVALRRRRVWPAAVVITASTPFIARTRESGVEHAALDTLDSLGGLPGRFASGAFERTDGRAAGEQLGDHLAADHAVPTTTTTTTASGQSSADSWA